MPAAMKGDRRIRSALEASQGHLHWQATDRKLLALRDEEHTPA
jgi:hypothetical protein